MCVPAAPLAIGAAVISATGKLVGGISAAQQYRASAQVDQQNAAYANEQAVDAASVTRAQAQRRYREAAQVQGAQTAGMAANGVDLAFGSAADVVRDTKMFANEDVAEIYKAGAEKLKGFDREAWSYRASAAAKRAQASGAITQGIFGAFSTALGGASQVARMKGPKVTAAAGAYGISGSDGIY